MRNAKAPAALAGAQLLTRSIERMIQGLFAAEGLVVAD